MLITQINFNWPKHPGTIKAWATVTFLNEVSINNITLMEECVGGKCVRSIRYPSRNVAQKGQEAKYVPIFSLRNPKNMNELETRVWAAYDALRPADEISDDVENGDSDE